MLPNHDAVSNPKSPKSPHPDFTRRALAYLHDRGAHFVLCRPDKGPLWGAWQRRRPALETVLHHGFVGVIPWSLGASALDVDRGEPDQLTLRYPPLVVLHSQRQGGVHAYFRDTEPRPNAKFTLLGCSGEIRGARGYLLLWVPQSPIQLLFALLHNPEPCLFPAGDLVTGGTRYRQPDEPGDPYQRKISREPIDLRTVYPGSRNNSLFDETRFWAYAEPKPRGMHDWDRAVLEYAQRRNRDFRRPLPVREVGSLALSVSTWVWSGGGPTRHSYTQEERRRGGVTRGRQQSYDAREKHAAIMALHAQGEKQTVIAAHVGLSRPRVSQIIRANAKS